MGHSLGGFAALMTAADDPRIRAVAAIAAFDLGAAGALAAADPRARAELVAAFDGETLPLAGTSGEALVAEMAANADAWRLTGRARALRGRPVLLVGADRDTVAVPGLHFEPLAAAFGTAERLRLDADHALSGARIALIRAVAAFLARAL